MASKSKKSCQGKDTFERMNYLYQAAQELTGKNNVLSCYYGSQLKSISRKSVLRMEPEMKRTICKKCGLILKPGISTELNITSEQNGKTKICSIKCSKCTFTKRYVLNKNYDLWFDNENSIKEIMQPDDTSSDRSVSQTER